MSGLVLTVISARADMLPPVQYQALMGLNPGNDPTFTVIGGVGTTVLDCAQEIDTDCLTATLRPSGEASMKLFGFAGQFSNLRADLTYYFEVSGPSGMFVPITISYEDTYDFRGVDTATQWAVSAGINVSGNIRGLSGEAFCGSIYIPNCTPTTVTGTLRSSFSTNFSTNIPYQVELTVSGQIENGVDGASFVSATSDPMISFAPGFDSTGYDILVSDGISNGASTTPEPATGWLVGLVIVFALAAGLGRRAVQKRREPVSAGK